MQNLAMTAERGRERGGARRVKLDHPAAGAWIAISGGMGRQTLNRTDALQIVRRAADTLRATKANPGDAAAISSALARACGEVGIDAAAFDAFIASDAELQHLKESAIREAVAGSTDPGPHDAISREAATGKPGDHAVGPGAPGAFTNARR